MTTEIRVTVAIPLHNSKRWIENVVSNVRRMPTEVTEILISDQTCVDDAAMIIKKELSNDPRVKVMYGSNGLELVDHYQMLLEVAEGDFFMWMPQDDVFGSRWVPTLMESLIKHPSAWLAFGEIRYAETTNGTNLIPKKNYPLPFKPGLFSIWQSIDFLNSGWAHYAFKGLFRRREVLAANIRMDPDHSTVWVDHEWVFSVALHGNLVFDNSIALLKRMHDSNTHRTDSWIRQVRGSLLDAVLKILDKYAPNDEKKPILMMYAHFSWVKLNLYILYRYGKNVRFL
jgi:GT2 family glycosyltransferase